MLPCFITRTDHLFSPSAIDGNYYFTPGKDLSQGDCSLTIKSVRQQDIGSWSCAALIIDTIMEASDDMYLSYESKYAVIRFTTATVTNDSTDRKNVPLLSVLYVVGTKAHCEMPSSPSSVSAPRYRCFIFPDNINCGE